MALREVQDLLAGDDLLELDVAVSQLQEAVYGLNRRLASERKVESNPLQGLRNTLGSLKDELFSDDYEDDWDRDRYRSLPSRDPWAQEPWRDASRIVPPGPQRDSFRDGPPSRDRSWGDRWPAADDPGRGMPQEPGYGERRRRSGPLDDDPWAEN
jgi:molecular chaperone DnaK